MAEALAAAISGEGAERRAEDPPAPKPLVSPFASTALAASGAAAASSRAVSNDSEQRVAIETHSGVGLSSRVLPRRKISAKALGVVFAVAALVGVAVLLPRLLGGTAAPTPSLVTAERRPASAPPKPVVTENAKTETAASEVVAIAPASTEVPPLPKPRPTAAATVTAWSGGSVGAAVTHLRTTASAKAPLPPSAPPPAVSVPPKTTKPPDDDGIK